MIHCMIIMCILMKMARSCFQVHMIITHESHSKGTPISDLNELRSSVSSLLHVQSGTDKLVSKLLTTVSFVNLIIYISL